MTDQEESDANVSVVVVDDDDDVASTAKTLTSLQEHHRYEGRRQQREQREHVAADRARTSTAANDGEIAGRSTGRQTLRTRHSSSADHLMLCEICFISFGTFESLEIHFEKFHDKNAVLTVTMTDDEADFRPDLVQEARITFGHDEASTAGADDDDDDDDDEGGEYEEIVIPRGAYDEASDSTTRPALRDGLVDPVNDVVQTVHEMHQQRQMDDVEHELRFSAGQRRSLHPTLNKPQSPNSFVSLNGLAPRTHGASDLQHIFVDVEGSVEDEPDEDIDDRPPVLTPLIPHKTASKRSYNGDIGADVGPSSARRMRFVRRVALDANADDEHYQFQLGDETSYAQNGTQQQLRPLVSTEQTTFDMRLVQNVRNKGGRPRSVRPRLIDDESLFRCPSCMTVFQTDEACSIHQRAMHGVIYRSCF
uniref:C2H2-type domain-containing protein n=1 Tax=Plectus sambesii TaxID=2011161 RepID=A0A914UKY4_9BILA